jgi:hypothetical protein
VIEISLVFLGAKKSIIDREAFVMGRLVKDEV